MLRPYNVVHAAHNVVHAAHNVVHAAHNVVHAVPDAACGGTMVLTR
jgi:hypothetical protein